MPEYVYLIVRTNEIGEEKTVAACKTLEAAQEWQAELETLQELHTGGWTYTIETLKLAI